MSTEENFDDLLKSKLDGAEFAFNEANWEKAETLILAADKKRKRKRIAIIFFIGLFIGVCFMIPFIIENKVENTINNKKKSANYSETIKFQNTNNLIGKKPQSVKMAAKNIKTKNKTINEVEINTKKEAKNGVTEKNKFEDTDGKLTLNKNPVIPQKENNKKLVLYKAKTSKTSFKAKKTKADRGKNARNRYVSHDFIPKKDELAIGGNLEKKETNYTNNKPTNGFDKTVSVQTKQEEKTIVAVKTDTTKMVTPIANNIPKDTIVVLKDSVVKPKPDSLATNKFDLKNSKGFVYSIDAGANYALGWKNNSIKEANGFNAVFGISVTHFFTKKWSGLIGLQYTSLAHLNYSNYTSNNIQYSFGYNQTKTIITPTMLYYIAIPVKAQYYFNDKNSLSIGINALYLLNTNSTIETDVRSDFDANKTTFATKKGYRDGFATFDFQPALAYRRKIYKALSLSAEVYYGLMDIKSNTAFGINKAEHNSGLKLTLSYNIIHK